MRIIKLTQGEIATVSDEDYDRLSGYRYKLLKDGGRRYAYRESGDTLIGLHQDVMRAKEGMVVDHRDRDGLNNVRRNLRYATRSQNQANSLPRKPATAHSLYKGVTLHHGKWIARIKVKGVSHHLGTFTDDVSAAKAYDAAARIHFREFSSLNFP